MLTYGYRIANIVIFKQTGKGKVPSILQKTKQKYYNTIEVDELLTLLAIRKKGVAHLCLQWTHR